MPKLLVNKWKTPDGTILHSKHRHDYVSHLDGNGKYYSVDGGNDYVRTTGYLDMTNLCVYSDAPHEVIRENVVWGTRGKGGQQPLVYKPLKDLDTDHIEAIIETQTHISGELKQVLKNELEYRLTSKELL